LRQIIKKKNKESSLQAQTSW